ncbi:MAG: TAT-variant-translocated molybdopterin oxidoreductase [Proteobacteria bacterium]|nr:TAT-variant-translocated molybdopterin oxidoreductase [Pseudomonadota bacterium]
MSSLGKETKYWRSLAELESSDELDSIVAREFPDQAAELSDPLSRRRFMQLMGASVAFAGVAGVGCRRWEREEIVPLSNRPEDYVPGVNRYFATAMELSGVASGLVVSSFDGRPIKIEGNPEHPFLAGNGPREQGNKRTSGSSSFAQASILGLYDPDRSGSVRRAEGAGSWDDFAALVKDQKIDPSQVRVLSEATSSPTMARLRDELLRRYPSARWYEYDPLTTDNEHLGTKMAFGRPLRPLARLDRSRVIVSLDADLFYFHPAAVRYAGDFAVARDPDSARPMTRLYAIESAFTTTGAKADHRLAVPSSEIGSILAELEGAINGATPKAAGKAGRFISALAEDLRKHRGRSVLVAGSKQPPAVHALVAKINHSLGAVGTTLEYLREPPGPERLSHVESIKSLAADMNAGKVETLLILGGNPVYDAPADVDFAAGLRKVKTSIHLSEHYDETSSTCSWHLPRANYLEAWGDVRAFDGTISIQQPLIEPLWQGKSSIEVLTLFTSGDYGIGRGLVRTTFEAQIARGGDERSRESAWRKALHDGFITGTRYQSVTPSRPGSTPAVAEVPAIGPNNIEVVLTGSSHTYDGRFANNAWLQETPDFMTKLTWDNAALVNPNTADELGIAHGDMIRIRLGSRQVEVPVYTMPGQAKFSIALALGHGRKRAGRVGGSVDDGIEGLGFDGYSLRTSDSMYVATGAAVEMTGASYALVSTQDHWKIDKLGKEGAGGYDDRMPTLIRSCDVDDYQGYKKAKNKDLCFGEGHEVKLPLGDLPGRNRSLWQEHRYDRDQKFRRASDGRTVSRSSLYKWGMAIDLNKCTGCNSCMLACQSENNVPVVGKEQVANSREMHWIRIDRYFTGDDVRDDPRVAYQPLTCQQCENAPCEQVCPVGATIHSREGLNDMVYNRCIGTRYCMNNCPYKVRRFNFLHYQNRPERPGGSLEDARNKVRQLLFNPEVTVRSRGVMEKCTFCVQRIQNKKIVAKNERRSLRDGEIVTACQQACPSDAITFGDLNDPDSQVSKAHKLAQPANNPSGRGYELLRELNNKPRNIFLAEVRNPNTALEPPAGSDSKQSSSHG